MHSRTMQIRRAAAALAGALILTSSMPALAQYGSDPIPFAPYGMDPVPPADFDTDPWDRYGSDPVPQSFTSDFNIHTWYGEDPVPDGFVPTVQSLKDVLPRQSLQVLTRAIEDGKISPQGSGRVHPRRHKPAAHPGHRNTRAEQGERRRIILSQDPSRSGA